MDNNGIRELRFWCQKVIPLVYDDSLSYYEVLCKLSEKLNEVIKVTNKLPDEIQKLVDQRLSTDEIAKAILRITDYPWNQKEEDRAEYQRRVCKSMASFLERMVGSDCVLGNQKRTVYKYNTNLGYMGLMGRYLEFKTDDTIDINGTTYPVAYMDCSVFASLVTKCHTWETSAYGYVYGGGTDKQSALFHSFENGTEKTMPYTFDFLNNCNANRQAEILYKAGSPLYEWNPASVGDSLANAETGDLMFRGPSGNATFLGIDHIGVYVKTLEELQAWASDGVVFKPLGSTSDNGYIVHFSGATADEYKNTLKIQSVEDWIHAPGDLGAYRYFWGKAISCALTSNKARANYNHKICCYDFDLMVAQETGVDVENNQDGIITYNVAEIVSHVPGGIILKKNDNLDALYNGVYRCTTTNVLNSLSGKPSDLNSIFTMEQKGVSLAGNMGEQILYPQTTATVFYIRNKMLAGSWTAWKKITI